FNVTSTTTIYTLTLHDALPICSHFVLNGEKRYITNASIAQVLTVMARTPVPGKEGKTAITAFLVTPDMPGFEILEARMPKMGIRDRKSTRLNSSHVSISYAVFC